jgi:hypothetical protein
MTSIDIKKERRRGMRKMLLIIIALTFTCCDVHIANVRVWYSPMGQLADALHKLHGGEPHDGNRTNE